MAPKRRKSSSSADRKTKGKGKNKDTKRRSPTPQEKPDYPDDIFPMVFTSATQELLGCCADEDVTRESPYKLLNKDDIIRDIKTRAAVSDFSPVKQIVLDYPEEMMLLVYDWNFTYGQSFFLVLTPEARDRIFTPQEPEPPEVQDEVIKTLEPKPWISLGSKQEVDEESVREGRVKLRYEFSRVRRKFGLAISFSNRNAAVVKESSQKCPSNQDSRFSIKQMQRDCGIQVEQKLQSSSAQTHWTFLKNIFTHYEPSQLSEMEKTTVLQSKGLKTFCNSVFISVSQALQEEAIMNTCIDDWKALETADAGDWALKASESLPFYQAFADQKYSKGKKISTMNWHPTIQGVVAVALTDIKEEQWEESSTSDVTAAFIVFYCFSDPNSSQLLLECPDDVLAFDFCPSNPNIIVGGCINGQVVSWDISTQVTHLQEAQTGAKKVSVNIEAGNHKDDHTPVVCHTVVSATESSHKGPITDVQWLPQTFHLPGAESRKAPTLATKTGLPVENKYSNSVQVVTCSPDRTVMFWDVRIPNLPKQNVELTTPPTPCTASENLKHSGQTWKPLLRMFVTKNEAKREFAPLKISLEPSTWSQNTSSNTEKSNEDESSEVIPEISQPECSPKTITPEDGNTNFYMGTEDGEIVYADWKLVHEDSGRMYSTRPLFCRRIHHGLVNTVQRSPFYKDIVLTVGGQNFAIWKEDVKDGPVIVSPSSEEECSAGCWSPARPAVFFIGKDNGSIEVWNLLTNVCAPSQIYPYVTNVKITCIKPWILSPKQHLLAVVDLGMLRVFELPRTLRTPVKKESLNVTKYFELERDRLMDCLKTQEVCEKPQQEAGGQKKEDDKLEESLQEAQEANMKEYSDYLKLRELLKTVAPNLNNEDD